MVFHCHVILLKQKLHIAYTYKQMLLNQDGALILLNQDGTLILLKQKFHIAYTHKQILLNGCIFSALCINQSNEKFYEEVLMPATRLLPPEFSHKAAVWACKNKLLGQSRADDGILMCFFGSILKNPIGLAAGFDKHAEAVEGLSQLGFGFIEIGSVTPEPQPGQPKPRAFRLVADGALENGGLSDATLRSKSTRLVAQMYYQIGWKIPIIGVGGILFILIKYNIIN
uniref:Dihydroorotate dehydrogenase catalytic domain-containing protein n=1 Tax=Glossina austeni TaxID=7395 RepID=A0A1A9UWV6_GLOAU